MKDTYFKIIGQEADDTKILMVAVLPKNIFRDHPAIFEVQGIITAPTIYTGTYPTIRINLDTIENRTEELKGMGIAGIVTREEWYIKSIEKKDQFNIGI